MMRNTDKGPLVTLSDVPAAIGLLTRLPARVDTELATARGAAAAWAYPIVGLIVSVIAVICMTITSAIGLPAGAAALIGVATATIITGAMHEDGLADAADGLWGGWDPVHRLKIMKDTYIGAYGVIAIVLSLLMRWLLLTELIQLGAGAALIAAAMLSRAAMVGVMTWLPNARTSGLSRAVGRPNYDRYRRCRWDYRINGHRRNRRRGCSGGWLRFNREGQNRRSNGGYTWCCAAND